VRRWHPDIDDCQLRAMFADQIQQFRGVTCLPDDLEARSLEQAGQAFAEQDVVIGDDYAHGVHRVDSCI
jgi:hypothetical protein